MLLEASLDLFSLVGLRSLLIFIPLLFLLLWRLWSFTVRPLLHSNEPPYLPYWIPFFGHAISFYKNATSLYAYGKKHFGDSTAPYMLYVAGENFVVITTPKDVSRVYNDQATFSFDPFIDIVYKGVGNVSNAGNRILWRTPKEGFTSIWPNPKGNVLVHTGNALLHKQLLQPNYLQNLSEVVLKFIEENTRWDTFFKSSIITADPNLKVVSLHRWCRDVLITSQTNAFFGKHFMDIEPKLTQIFDDWDLNAWMITFQFPEFMATAATQPRDKLIKSLVRYLESPQWQRADGVPFVGELEEESYNAGLSQSDCARVLMIILWGLNSNVQMITFWVLTHIIQRPQLLASIRKEITPLMKSLDPLDALNGEDLTNLAKKDLLDECPLLQSAISEVLRVCFTGVSIRKVTESAVIGGKTLPIGANVLLPQRSSLLSNQAFGPDAHKVDLQRFMHNKTLQLHENYRVYGGGVTLCSGRVLGKREIVTFVAITLWRYDIEMLQEGCEALGVEGKPAPRLDEGKPSMGIAKQVEGDDLIVKISLRTLH